MQKICCLLNHTLTPNQLSELRKMYGTDTVLYPPASLKALWSALPLEPQLSHTTIQPVIDWFSENRIGTGDVMIIQGEFGITFAIVDYCLQHGITALHAVTERVAEETATGESITRKYVFKHICFRPYMYYENI